MVTLDDYITAARGQRWAWGSVDCTLFAADWVQSRTGIDPAESIRGRYHDDAGANAILAEMGGLLGTVAPLMDRYFARTETPAAGDVGVIIGTVAGGETRPVAAIHVGQTWAARTLRGIVMGAFPTVAAWTIPVCSWWIERGDGVMIESPVQPPGPRVVFTDDDLLAGHA